MRLPFHASPLVFVFVFVLVLAAFSACGGESLQAGAGGSSGKAGASGAGASGGSAGAADPTACEQPSECVVAAARCCGGSNPPALAELTAVNASKLEDFTAPCRLVDCAATIGPIPAHFGATCRAGHCVAFDVRTEQYTACSSHDECVLRNGLGCCEGCSRRSEDFVAIRADAELTELVCGSGSVTCPACAVFAEGFSSGCLQGHCEVVLQPR